MTSVIDMFAPNTTTIIDDFKVEEFITPEPIILPGFEGQHKGTTTLVFIIDDVNWYVVDYG